LAVVGQGQQLTLQMALKVLILFSAQLHLQAAVLEPETQTAA
jgi:hypothetical protein